MSDIAPAAGAASDMQQETDLVARLRRSTVCWRGHTGYIAALHHAHLHRQQPPPLPLPPFLDGGSPLPMGLPAQCKAFAGVEQVRHIATPPLHSAA